MGSLGCCACRVARADDAGGDRQVKDVLGAGVPLLVVGGEELGDGLVSRGGGEVGRQVVEVGGKAGPVLLGDRAAGRLLDAAAEVRAEGGVVHRLEVHAEQG